MAFLPRKEFETIPRRLTLDAYSHIKDMIGSTPTTDAAMYSGVVCDIHSIVDRLASSSKDRYDGRPSQDRYARRRANFYENANTRPIQTIRC